MHLPQQWRDRRSSRNFPLRCALQNLSCRRRFPATLAAVRRLEIASEIGRDRPHLLIAGGHQEGWRSSITFDTHRKIAGFRMSKLTVTVWRDAAAGMQIWINDGTERLRAFKPRVQIEAQCPCPFDIGPLAGRNNDPDQWA